MTPKKRFLKLKDEIKVFNESYYNSQPQISDADFDKLKFEYENLLLNNPTLKKYDDIGVGSTPTSKFQKIKHILPMLSLANSFNINDLKDFFTKASNFMKSKENKESYIIDCKIDGVSLSLTYKNQKLVTNNAKILSNAARHFSMGMRSYYYAIAVLSWYLNPILFIIFTSLIVMVIFRREFMSKALDILS